MFSRGGRLGNMLGKSFGGSGGTHTPFGKGPMPGGSGSGGFSGGGGSTRGFSSSGGFGSGTSGHQQGQGGGGAKGQGFNFEKFNKESERDRKNFNAHMDRELPQLGPEEELKFWDDCAEFLLAYAESEYFEGGGSRSSMPSNPGFLAQAMHMPEPKGNSKIAPNVPHASIIRFVKSLKKPKLEKLGQALMEKGTTGKDAAAILQFSYLMEVLKEKTGIDLGQLKDISKRAPVV